jgi:hypothetical protein
VNIYLTIFPALTTPAVGITGVSETGEAYFTGINDTGRHVFQKPFSGYSWPLSFAIVTDTGNVCLTSVTDMGTACFASSSDTGERKEYQITHQICKKKIVSRNINWDQCSMKKPYVKKS